MSNRQSSARPGLIVVVFVDRGVAGARVGFGGDTGGRRLRGGALLGDRLGRCLGFFVGHGENCLRMGYAIGMSADKPVDLRSDTLTQPSAAMREAMARAEVGDDVYGEDPTVRALEERVAELLGKETALFVPSGTQGNQIAIQLHTRPGDLVVVGKLAHVMRYEAGAAGAFGGVQFVETPSSIFDADELVAADLTNAFYRPRPRLVAMENTHNSAGGRVFPLVQMQAVAEVARAHGMGVHMDGARLWNASAATGTPERDYAEVVDTVSVCFSKGLGAPVGSALAMPAAMREEALRIRRRFGGAMRQAGIIAAGALHALEHHREELSADHVRTQRLATRLAEAGAPIDLERVETNIVIWEEADPAAYVASAREQGVYLNALDHARVRAVVHRDLDDAQIERAAEVLARFSGSA